MHVRKAQEFISALFHIPHFSLEGLFQNPALYTLPRLQFQDDLQFRLYSFTPFNNLHTSTNVELSSFITQLPRQGLPTPLKIVLNSRLRFVTRNHVHHIQNSPLGGLLNHLNEESSANVIGFEAYEKTYLRLSLSVDEMLDQRTHRCNSGSAGDRNQWYAVQIQEREADVIWS
jgi:hypothetical protein